MKLLYVNMWVIIMDHGIHFIDSYQFIDLIIQLK